MENRKIVGLPHYHNPTTTTTNTRDVLTDEFTHYFGLDFGAAYKHSFLLGLLMFDYTADFGFIIKASSGLPIVAIILYTIT